MKKKFVKKSYIFYILMILILTNRCEVDNDTNESIEIARSIVGTWKCKEKDYEGTTEFTYNVIISIKDYDSTIVRIYNFFNIGQNYYVKGKVNGYTITLNSGFFGNGYNLEAGNGTISTGLKKIEFTYTIDEGDEIKKKFLATYSK